MRASGESVTGIDIAQGVDVDGALGVLDVLDALDGLDIVANGSRDDVIAPGPSLSFRAHSGPIMWLLIVEALAALLLLIGLVWWTMFSGRRRGERATDSGDDPGVGGGGRR